MLLVFRRFQFAGPSHTPEVRRIVYSCQSKLPLKSSSQTIQDSVHDYRFPSAGVGASMFVYKPIFVEFLE